MAVTVHREVWLRDDDDTPAHHFATVTVTDERFTVTVPIDGEDRTVIDGSLEGIVLSMFYMEPDLYCPGDGRRRLAAVTYSIYKRLQFKPRA